MSLPATENSLHSLFLSNSETLNVFVCSSHAIISRPKIIFFTSLFTIIYYVIAYFRLVEKKIIHRTEGLLTFHSCITTHTHTHTHEGRIVSLMFLSES